MVKMQILVYRLEFFVGFHTSSLKTVTIYEGFSTSFDVLWNLSFHFSLNNQLYTGTVICPNSSVFQPKNKNFFVDIGFTLHAKGLGRVMA